MQCKRPITKRRKDNTEYTHRCGQCIFCRVTKSQEWAFRLLLEAEKTNGLALFVTLTYMEQHLPKTESGLPTVRVQHLRQFVRDLRRNNPTWRVRYFAPTEYGKRGGRPHGHAALFIEGDMPVKGWQPKGENLKKLEANRIKWRQYGPIEREVLRAWGCKGSIQVAEFNRQRAAYLAKYLVKSETIKTELDPDQEPEQFTMSPGLGRDAIPDLAEEIRKAGGTLLELKKPGLLVDASTWAVDLSDRPIGIRNAPSRQKKTYPVARYIREKLINHLGGDMRTDREKRIEEDFREELRRLESFTHRESRAEKTERVMRRRLREQGQL